MTNVLVVSSPLKRVCIRLRCFEKIPEDSRQNLLITFNSLRSKNEQDNFLSGLISFHAPWRRRSRKPKNEEQSEDEISDDPEAKQFANNAVFSYKVRISDSEIPVCFKAFLAIFGIARGRVRRIQDFLLHHGRSPRDRRGTHQNRPNKMPREVEDLIVQHIQSFKARQSHYSRRKNPDRVYLPETLSIKKMFKMFLEKYNIAITYKAYWTIFTRKFNISFGLPRSDTCSVCDNLMLQINATIDPERKQDLTAQKALHLAKADKFYELKRKFKLRARQGELTCLSFDYMQNLPLPHLQTSDVFFPVSCGIMYLECTI
ncbi:unnamed protein product [Callosobruchus maculatus]|uniref:Uncharacterized protein n=1 Tax=Callosobruchus maculatus TaxID=64391 RepID=A0A653DBP5_CALMS|nr:unnamed protein product [Callosobruchus maculatus]